MAKRFRKHFLGKLFLRFWMLEAGVAALGWSWTRPVGIIVELTSRPSRSSSMVGSGSLQNRKLLNCWLSAATESVCEFIWFFCGFETSA